MEPQFEILVNGNAHIVRGAPNTPLLDVLRDELGLTGAKYGCGEGACGACTVLVGGKAVHACVTEVSDVGKLPVVTIEALAEGDKLHPLQEAFLEEGAMQCGYCVPGMIMAAYAFVPGKPHPTPFEIDEHMSGNVCRCGGYPAMRIAIAKAAGKMGSVK